MNIFYLDHDPETCAKYHCDQHVIKMILESAQMLSTANRIAGLDEGYRKTHVNHPSSVWVRQSKAHWLWLRELARFLNIEYRYRRDHEKDHKSWEMIASLSVPPLPDIGFTPPPQAMPDYCRRESSIDGYRLYYYHEKADFATWTGRPLPQFLLDIDKQIHNY